MIQEDKSNPHSNNYPTHQETIGKGKSSNLYGESNVASDVRLSLIN